MLYVDQLRAWLVTKLPNFIQWNQLKMIKGTNNYYVCSCIHEFLHPWLPWHIESNIIYMWRKSSQFNQSNIDSDKIDQWIKYRRVELSTFGNYFLICYLYSTSESFYFIPSVNSCVHEPVLVCSVWQIDSQSESLYHRCELPGNYPVFTVVMVIYTFVRRISIITLPPNFFNNFIYISIKVYNLSRRTLG